MCRPLLFIVLLFICFYQILSSFKRTFIKYVQYIKNHNAMNNSLPTTYLKRKNITFMSPVGPCQVLIKALNFVLIIVQLFFVLPHMFVCLNKILVNFVYIFELYILWKYRCKILLIFLLCRQDSHCYQVNPFCF